MSSMTRKIDRTLVEDIYELSPIQEGILFHYLKDEGRQQYIEQLELKVAGVLDPVLLQDSWNQLIAEHDMLRTIFRWERVSRPLQVVLKNQHSKVKYFDIRGHHLEKRMLELGKIKEEDFEKGFNIREECVRLRLILFSEDESFLLLSYHHIILDGWSNGIIVNELMAKYGSQVIREDNLKKKTRYKSYVEEQKKFNSDAADLFWKNYMQGFQGVVIKPDSEGSAGTGKYGSIKRVLGSELKSGIERFSREHKCTVANVFYLAWSILLHKYTSSSDLVFGTTVSTRHSTSQDFQNTLGLFINTLPLRIRISPDSTIAELIREISKSANERIGFEITPIVNIKKMSQASTSEELFQTIIAIENYPISPPSSGAGFHVVGWSINEYTNYDLGLDIETFGNVAISVKFNTNLFSEEFAGRLLAHYIKTIENISLDAVKTLKNIEMISGLEKTQILDRFNNTRYDFNPLKPFPEIFEETALTLPDKVAVICNNDCITYGELNNGANKLAEQLLENNVKRGDILGVLMERSEKIIISVLAIWKIGCTYLPLDIGAPLQRNLQVLKHGGVKHLLIDGGQLQKSYTGEGIIAIDIKKSVEKDFSAKQLSSKAEFDDIAYVIYTSGSTGIPKGAMVEHRGMHNHMMCKVLDLELGPQSVIIQNASQCFDISIWQFFSAMIKGGTVCILREETVLDAGQFISAVNNSEATVLEVIPSYLNVILDLLNEQYKLASLKYLLVTGDVCNAKQVNRVFDYLPGVCVINAYGPTEASDDITHYKMHKKIHLPNVPVGKPLYNLNIYILDPEDRLCPVGVVGEICVAGVGVGRGYLNDVERTGSAFVEDNVYKSNDFRMYRTGDLGRWLTDGAIEFHGRKDHQIKIRGYRVELQEIERAIERIENVKEAVVVCEKNESDKQYLRAYFTSDKETSPGVIRDALKLSLPAYMIPSEIAQIMKFNFTRNGKIDRNNLPTIADDVRLPEIYNLTDNAEKKLGDIFSSLLDKQNGDIDPRTDFFELGGDSLALIKLHSAIEKTFNLKLSVTDIFNLPTIESIAKLINSEEVRSAGEMKIVPIRLKDKLNKIENNTLDGDDVIQLNIAGKEFLRIRDFCHSKDIKIENMLFHTFVLMANTISNSKETHIYSIAENRDDICCIKTQSDVIKGMMDGIRLGSHINERMKSSISRNIEKITSYPILNPGDVCMILCNGYKVSSIRELLKIFNLCFVYKIFDSSIELVAEYKTNFIDIQTIDFITETFLDTIYHSVNMDNMGIHA